MEASGVFISWETDGEHVVGKFVQGEASAERPTRRRRDGGRHGDHAADGPPVEGDLAARDAIDERGVHAEKLHAPRGQRRLERGFGEGFAAGQARAGLGGADEGNAVAVFVLEQKRALRVEFVLEEGPDSFQQMLTALDEKQRRAAFLLRRRGNGVQGEERVGRLAEKPPAYRAAGRRDGVLDAVVDDGLREAGDGGERAAPGGNGRDGEPAFGRDDEHGVGERGVVDERAPGVVGVEGGRGRELLGGVGGEGVRGGVQELLVNGPGAFAGFEALVVDVLRDEADGEDRRHQRQERQQDHQRAELAGLEFVGAVGTHGGGDARSERDYAGFPRMTTLPPAP